MLHTDKIFKDDDLKRLKLEGEIFNRCVFRDVDLTETDIKNAEIIIGNFTGRGGKTKIKRDQVDDFLQALGVIIDE